MGFISNLLNREREPTVIGPAYKMISTQGDYYYSYDGNLYKSDIVRACIRPKIKAIGKLNPKHVRRDATGIQVNPVPYIKELLEHPNPLMTGQMWREKMATKLALTNNAFSLIIRDTSGKAMALYPIPCVMAEAVWQDSILYIRFTMEKSCKIMAFPYSDLIHLRSDYGSDQVFGSDPSLALTQIMECISTADQSIVKAVKNSGVIRWLLKFNSAMRPEDVKKNTKEFVNNYLNVESETFGAAGIDSKADAQQIKPNDYVPNALQSEAMKERLYSFFNTNKKIVQSEWNEDEWTAYYEAEVEPVAIQLGKELTAKLFTRKEQAFGNEIVFESTNLQCASIATKLQFVSFFDRGIMNANEIREVFNLAPIPTGEEYYVRKDTGKIEEGGND